MTPKLRDTYVHGDVNGNSTAQKRALIAAGLVDGLNLDWQKPGDSYVQLGDEGGDRKMGTQLIYDLSHSMRQQVRAAGGEYVKITGNHDISLLAYMAGFATPGLDKESMFRGLREMFYMLHGKDPATWEELVNDTRRNDKHWQLARVEWMKVHPRGEKWIELFREQKLFHGVGSTLLMHCQPTLDMAKMIEKFGIDLINAAYQAGMHSWLDGIASFKEAIWVPFSGFLNPNNRWSESHEEWNQLSHRLYESGYTRAVTGHTDRKKESHRWTVSPRRKNHPKNKDRKFEWVSQDRSFGKSVLSPTGIVPIGVLRADGSYELDQFEYK